MYVWFCTAEKWNKRSPGDSIIVGLSTIKWNRQIKRAPHCVLMSHRPALSADECALFWGDSYTLALVAQVAAVHTHSCSQRGFKLTYCMMTVTADAHEEINRPGRNMLLHRNLFGLQWHFTASCQFWSFCQRPPHCGCRTHAVGDWCKQIPDTRTGLCEAWVLPLKSSRKDLQWNYSGCFLSVQRHWKGGTVPVSTSLRWGFL